MGDTIIITDDKEQPAKPDKVIVVEPKDRETTEKKTVITEQTVVTERRED